MKTGVILHHKYYNGVVPQPLSTQYRTKAYKYFKTFGMFGTGMFGMIAKGSNIETDYDWRNTDLLIQNVIDNDSEIHFNTVITGHIDLYPQWYKELSPNQKLIALENHVRAVVQRYKGKISFFKLLNEVVREPDSNYLGTTLSKVELISNIFNWAVEEYPEGRYMINEYGSIIREEIRFPFLKLIDGIRNRGARIDIIGEQGHCGYYPRPFFLPPDVMIKSSLDEIHSNTNLPIIITEFDLGPKNGDYEGGSIEPTKPVEWDGITYKTWYEYQGFAYTHMKEICESKEYIEALYYWSFVDDPTITWERKECGIFDQSLDLKTSMLELFK